MKILLASMKTETIAEKLNVIIKSAATFRRAWTEKICFITLNCLDLVLTVFATECGLYEMNPFVQTLLNTPLALLTIKIFIPVLIAWLIPGKLLLPAIIFLTLVVVWDVKELLAFLY